MKTLNKDQALEFGGKLWNKDSMERVYLSSDAVKAIVEAEGYKMVDISKKMKSAKTYLDCKSGELKSDVGMIRSALNGSGYKCVA
jgi:hypothetical protein